MGPERSLYLRVAVLCVAVAVEVAVAVWSGAMLGRSVPLVALTAALLAMCAPAAIAAAGWRGLALLVLPAAVTFIATAVMAQAVLWERPNRLLWLVAALSMMFVAVFTTARALARSANHPHAPAEAASLTLYAAQSLGGYLLIVLLMAGAWRIGLLESRSPSAVVVVILAIGMGKGLIGLAVLGWIRSRSSAVPERVAERVRLLRASGFPSFPVLCPGGPLGSRPYAEVFSPVPGVRRLTLSQAALQQLTDGELTSVMMHEAAHVHLRHDLLKHLLAYGEIVVTLCFAAAAAGWAQANGITPVFAAAAATLVGIAASRTATAAVMRRCERAADNVVIARGLGDELESSVRKVTGAGGHPDIVPMWSDHEPLHRRFGRAASNSRRIGA